MVEMVNPLKKLWRLLGPGLITGASDDDPSGIVTYSIAGAKLGNQALWSVLYTLPFMIVIQEMCARIGLSSSCGLAGNIKRYYSRWILISVSAILIIANTFNIGADVYGMASAISLLTPHSPVILSWIIILFILTLTVILPYKKIVRIFKWLSMTLLAYILAGFLVIDSWPTVIYQTFFPVFKFNGETMAIIVALFGTTISPYLFFWQASEEAEEHKLRAHINSNICGYRIVTKTELKRAMKDTRAGMIFSNIVAFFIIALSSSVLFKAGFTNIETISDAALALRPLAGDYAYLLFTAGVIGAGLLAIPVLAGSSAYVFSEIFNMKGSLNKPFSKAKEFYGVMIISIVIGMIIPYLGLSPIKALLYAAILNGCIAPILIGLIIHMSNNPAIVGPNVNGRLTNIMGYVTLFLMIAAVSIFFVMQFNLPQFIASVF
jgi:NRAMP (natural resistance-associated macrophage protein)-like metal ion transporter